MTKTGSKRLTYFIEKYQNRCQSCKQELCSRGKVNRDDLYPTIDHVIPQMWGGPNEPENMQLICLKCHRKKSDAERIYLIRVFKGDLAVDEALALIEKLWDFRNEPR